MKDNVKNSKEVDGVILSEEAIDQLKYFQNNGNDGLDSIQKVLSDAVCFIAKSVSQSRKNEKLEAANVMTGLSFLRDELQCFAKPL